MPQFEVGSEEWEEYRNVDEARAHWRHAGSSFRGVLIKSRGLGPLQGPAHLCRFHMLCLIYPAYVRVHNLEYLIIQCIMCVKTGVYIAEAQAHIQIDAANCSYCLMIDLGLVGSGIMYAIINRHCSGDLWPNDRRKCSCPPDFCVSASQTSTSLKI